MRQTRRNKTRSALLLSGVAATLAIGGYGVVTSFSDTALQEPVANPQTATLLDKRDRSEITIVQTVARSEKSDALEVAALRIESSEQPDLSGGTTDLPLTETPAETDLEGDIVEPAVIAERTNPALDVLDDNGQVRLPDAPQADDAAIVPEPAPPVVTVTPRAEPRSRPPVNGPMNIVPSDIDPAVVQAQLGDDAQTPVGPIGILPSSPNSDRATNFSNRTATSPTSSAFDNTR